MGALTLGCVTLPVLGMDLPLPVVGFYCLVALFYLNLLAAGVWMIFAPRGADLPWWLPVCRFMFRDEGKEAGTGLDVKSRELQSLPSTRPETEKQPNS